MGGGRPWCADRTIPNTPSVTTRAIILRLAAVKSNVIEWSIGIPKICRRAPDAAVTGLHGPASALVHLTTGQLLYVVGPWQPIAAQTPPLPMSLIAPSQDELSLIVKVPALTPIMDQRAIRKLRTFVSIQGRQLAFGGEIDNRGDEVDDVVRTAGQIHQVLQTRYRAAHSDRASRIRLRARQPPYARRCRRQSSPALYSQPV